MLRINQLHGKTSQFALSVMVENLPLSIGLDSGVIDKDTMTHKIYISCDSGMRGGYAWMKKAIKEKLKNPPRSLADKNVLAFEYE